MPDITTTSAVTEEATKQASNILSRLLGPMADEIGATFAEQVRGFRFKRQVNLLLECETYIKDKSINTKQISVKNLVPLLEHATMEEEIGLQEKWKALLINYVDANKNFTTNVYPYILSQISMEEVNCLEFLKKNKGGYDEGTIVHRLQLSSNAVIYNLLRLGLIHNEIKLKEKLFFKPPREDKWGMARARDYSPIEGTSKEYHISPLGIQFLEACTLA